MGTGKRNKWMVWCMLCIVLVIGGIIVYSQVISEGVVTGHVSSQDVDSFFISLNQTGRTLLYLDWSAPHGQTTDAVLKIELTDSTGLATIQYAKLSKTSLLVTVDLKSLPDKKSVDINVRVWAYTGESDYKLQIMKPGTTETSKFISNQAFFSFKITESSKDAIKLIWNDLGEGIASAKVKIYKKEPDKVTEVFNTKDAAGTYNFYPPCEIEIPELEPGDYTLVVEKRGNESGEIITQKNINPVDLSTEFLFRGMQGFQTDLYTINLTGQEKFIWLVWGKVTEKQDMPALEVSFLDAQGKEVVLTGGMSLVNLLNPQGLALIPVGGLTGDYQLKIHSKYQAVYYLGFENTSGAYTPVNFQSYTVSKEQKAGQKSLYELQFATAGERTINIAFTNRSQTAAQVEWGIGQTRTGKQTIEAGKSRTLSLKLTFDAGKTYSLWVETSTGSAQYTIDCSANALSDLKPQVMRYVLPVDTRGLTYFSGRVDPDYWKEVKFTYNKGYGPSILNYYDLETVPLIVSKEIILEDGKTAKQEVAVSGWELVPVQGVSSYPVGDSSKLVLVDQTDAHNTLRVFPNKEIKNLSKADKDKHGDTYRMMVNWINDGETKKVGTLRGKPFAGENFEFELWVGPIDRSAYVDEWNDYAYEKIKEARTTGIPVTKTVVWGDGTIHPSKTTLKTVIPLQLLQAKFLRESSYKDKESRYEPFWDMSSFYLEKNISKWLIKDMKAHKDEIGYIKQDDANHQLTIYEYFTKYRSEEFSNPTRTWYDTPRICYSELQKTSEDLAEKYIQIYLDYGSHVGDFWYKKWSKEKMSVDDLKRFDATANFEADIWSHIKTITIVQDDKSQAVIVNSDAIDDAYTITFSKPSTEDTETRWDTKWEESENLIDSNASDLEKKKTKEENEMIRSRNDKFRKHITQIVDAIQKVSKVNREGSSTPLTVLKEYLELYVKYEHQKVITWFEKGIKTDPSLEGKYQWLTTNDNPKNYFPKPFVAQRVISSSYGPSQIMLSTAWEYGYKYHPKIDPQKDDFKYSLSHYETSILLGIQMIGSNAKKANYADWVEVWNYALYLYNKSLFYPADLKNDEKQFIPKVQKQ